MRIVRNTPDQLIVRDRAVVSVLALLVIAAICGTLGSLAVLYGDDPASRLGGAVFVVVTVPLIVFALVIAKEQTHIFDRRRGVLVRRVRRLIGGGEERAIPLDRVCGVEVTVDREIADPDTYGIDLLIAFDEGQPPGRLPLRDYTSSGDMRPVHAAIERWLSLGN